MPGQRQEATFVCGLSGGMHFHRAGGFGAVTNHARGIADDVVDRHATLFIGSVVEIYERHGDSRGSSCVAAKGRQGRVMRLDVYGAQVRDDERTG